MLFYKDWNEKWDIGYVNFEENYYFILYRAFLREEIRGDLLFCFVVDLFVI